MTARRSLWLVAFLVAAPAPAAASDICAALDRIATASREAPPFASIRRGLAGGEAVVPGFRTEECRVGPAGIACDDISFNVSNFDGWPAPLDCPGLTPATPSDRRPGRRDRPHAYALSGLHIEYGFSCWGCAGGPHSYFSVSFEGGRRPED